jgi:hypothetical protein
VQIHNRGVSKECEKREKPALWLSMLSIFCRFHGLFSQLPIAKEYRIFIHQAACGTCSPLSWSVISNFQCFEVGVFRLDTPVEMTPKIPQEVRDIDSLEF